MKAKDFILNEPTINLKGIAEKMWPYNADAPSYLSKKLHEKDGRKWTEKDEANAREVLKALGKRIEGV